MDKLPDLYTQCRIVLLGCDEFQSDNSLRAIFANSQLRSYSSRVPEASSRDQRVDFCLNFLLDKRFRGEPLLALFLEILGNRYPNDDDTRIALHKLAKEARNELSRMQATQASASHDIDIGIVFALKEEFIELLEDFIETYEPYHDNELNTYSYHFQHMTVNKDNTYRCVATFVGGMGPTEAALATEKFISKWKPATCVLLGIAGALDNNVVLGDVVVANQVDLYQEDSKATSGKGEGLIFQLSGKVYTPSYKLRVDAEHFEIAHRKIFLRWQTQCAQELQQLIPQTEIARMVANRTLQLQPRISVGHIASGPTVGATAAFKDWLKNERDRKFQALEMESGGFMMALHEREYAGSLILRAISDYADERKKELDEVSKGAFRRYAVRNALRLLWSFFDTDIFRLTR